MGGRILSVAGSDGGGGAGVQGDIKTATALGCYAATAITALTAQNTLGVEGVWGVESGAISRQIRAVLGDIGADAVKTGMLLRREVMEEVCGELEGWEGALVVDPVMKAKGGALLVEEGAIEAMGELMVPRAWVLTPNAPEAEALTGFDVKDEAGLRRAGERLLEMGARGVLMKGGHIGSDKEVCDVWLDGEGEEEFRHERAHTRHTHGTGCALATATACGASLGLGMKEAAWWGVEFVSEAILRAPGLGGGHGPLGFLAAGEEMRRRGFPGAAATRAAGTRSVREKGAEGEEVWRERGV